MRRMDKHGQSGTRLYRIWKQMRYRCLNQKNKDYPNYGGRGIKICKEWEDSFIPFQKWALINGYKDNLTIDRINNDEGYYPENCRWATVAEQNRNRSNTLRVVIDKKKHSIATLSETTGIKPATIYRRIEKGEKDITRPIKDPHSALIGERFGMLTVIKFSHTNPDSYWLCKCDCGSYKIINGSHMKKGHVKSCGCIRGLPNDAIIIQEDLHGKVLDRFTSLKEAVEKTGVERRYIVSCIKGRSATARGYIFKISV